MNCNYPWSKREIVSHTISCFWFFSYYYRSFSFYFYIFVDYSNQLCQLKEYDQYFIKTFPSPIKKISSSWGVHNMFTKNIHCLKTMLYINPSISIWICLLFVKFKRRIFTTDIWKSDTSNMKGKIENKIETINSFWRYWGKNS